MIPQVCNVCCLISSKFIECPSTMFRQTESRWGLSGHFCTSCASLVFLRAATFGNGSAVRFTLSSNEAWEWTEKFCMFCWKGRKRIQPEQNAFQNKQWHIRKFMCSPLRDGILSDSHIRVIWTCSAWITRCCHIFAFSWKVDSWNPEDPCPSLVQH